MHFETAFTFVICQAQKTSAEKLESFNGRKKAFPTFFAVALRLEVQYFTTLFLSGFTIRNFL